MSTFLISLWIIDHDIAAINYTNNAANGIAYSEPTPLFRSSFTLKS